MCLGSVSFSIIYILVRRKKPLVTHLNRACNHGVHYSRHFSILRENLYLYFSCWSSDKIPKKFPSCKVKRGGSCKTVFTASVIFEISLTQSRLLHLMREWTSGGRLRHLFVSRHYTNSNIIFFQRSRKHLTGRNK
jgi:hypothetical protein